MMGKFWKSYFWLFVASTFLIAASALTWPEWHGYAVWSDYLLLALMLLGTVGMYGYAYAKRLCRQWCWKLLFVATILGEMALGLDDLFFAWNNTQAGLVGARLELVLLASVYLLWLPYYVGLYLYGFNANKVWQSSLG